MTSPVTLGIGRHNLVMAGRCVGLCRALGRTLTQVNKRDEKTMYWQKMVHEMRSSNANSMHEAFTKMLDICETDDISTVIGGFITRMEAEVHSCEARAVLHYQIQCVLADFHRTLDYRIQTNRKRFPGVEWDADQGRLTGPGWTA